jgi:prephenate dehydratase
MDIKVKKIKLWRTEVSRRSGALASALEPLAQHGADLKVIRVRAVPGRTKRNIVEVYAGEGQRVAMVARAAGFSQTPATAVLLQGDNRPGFAYEVANAVAWAGIGVVSGAPRCPAGPARWRRRSNRWPSTGPT